MQDSTFIAERVTEREKTEGDVQIYMLTRKEQAFEPNWCVFSVTVHKSREQRVGGGLSDKHLSLETLY